MDVYIDRGVVQQELVLDFPEDLLLFTTIITCNHFFRPGATPPANWSNVESRLYRGSAAEWNGVVRIETESGASERERETALRWTMIDTIRHEARSACPEWSKAYYSAINHLANKLITIWPRMTTLSEQTLTRSAAGEKLLLSSPPAVLSI